MRDLTEEELKLAPEGYPEYGFNRSGSVFFFNRDKGTAITDGIDKVLNISKGHYAYKECRYLPSPKKPFDIDSYEFSDKNAHTISHSGSELWIGVDYQSCVMMNKQDAIAIAKALGVTGEDLL